MWSNDSEFARRLLEEPLKKIEFLEGQLREKDLALKNAEEARLNEKEARQENERESTILKMALKGRSPADIADAMGISLATVSGIISAP